MHRTLLALIALPGCFALSAPCEMDDAVLLQEDASQVMLDVETGSVYVEVADVQAPEVYIHSTYTGETPVVEVWVQDGILNIIGECPSTFHRCSTDFEILVPEGVELFGSVVTGDLTVSSATGVDVDMVTGSASLTDVAGDVDVEVTTGDVEITGVGGDLRAELTTGSVWAYEVEGSEVLVDVTTGDVSLGLLEPEHVDLETTTGSVLVEVPEGTYELDLGVITGDVHTSGVCGEDGASRSIRAHSVTGSVTVLGV